VVTFQKGRCCNTKPQAKPAVLSLVLGGILKLCQVRSMMNAGMETYIYTLTEQCEMILK